MPHRQPRTRRCFVETFLAVLVAGLSVLTWAEPALAIPAFARKYQMSCTVCHVVFPKLTQQGEAFRRNGYQFPVEDELFVKSEPLALGSDAWKDMWPNSIWPSSIPGTPPLFVRTTQRMRVYLDPEADEDAMWEMDFPHEIYFGGAEGGESSARKKRSKDVEDRAPAPGHVDRKFVWPCAMPDHLHQPGSRKCYVG